MNAPRIVLHAALASVYGAVLLALFLWVANNGATSGAPVASLLPIVAAYVAVAGVVWPLLYGAIRFFASAALPVPWFGLRYLMAFHTVNTAAVLAACWATLARSRMVLDSATFDRLERILMAIGLAWAYAAVVSGVPRLRRSASLQSSAAGMALAALLAPAWSRPAGPVPAAPAEEFSRVQPPSRRLILLDFDGADLEDILTLLAQGKLPAFSRLKEEGAFGRLRSVLPCDTAVARTTLATGKLPLRHRVSAATARRLRAGGPWLQVVPAGVVFDLVLAPLLERRALSIGDRSTRTLWEMADLMGGESVAAGWEVDLDQEAAGAGSVEPEAVDLRLVADLLDGETLSHERATGGPQAAELIRAVRADAPVLEVLHRTLRDRKPGVVALSFPGLDAVAHAFLRYARPAEFGNVTSREIELFGGVLEGYYRRVDAIVGRALASCDQDTVLFVASSHGIDPTPLQQRLLAIASGAEWRSGTHSRGPGGFLFVRGPEVQPGVQFEKGAISDVVPTALYSLNLPVASDLDGSIRAGIFTARYTFDHPAAVIATYETGR